VPMLSKLAPDFSCVEHYIVVGAADTAPLAASHADVLHYDDLLAAESGTISYPEIDERAAAAMCYTSGTTGNPKGVVYSHRSTFLHSMAVMMADTLGASQADTILPILDQWVQVMRAVNG